MYVHLFVFQIHLCFPEEGLVYDYRLDDAGITNMEDDYEDEERKVSKLWLKIQIVHKDKDNCGSIFLTVS